MANTKISGFPQVKNNDVPLITSFAAVGTDGSDNVGVNVRISGNSLITSLEQQLDLSNFLKGTLAVGRGGTGQTSYTNGQLLIGNTTGNTLSKATLTQGAGITITNGNGSITVANSAPDQTVALTGGTGITTSGTYPNFTITNDSPNQATPAASDGSPSTGQLQYNDGSNGFAASANLTFTGSSSTPDTLTIKDNIIVRGDGSTNAGKLRLECYDNSNTHYVDLIGPDHGGGASSYSIKFPATGPGANNKILQSNSSGALSWIDTPTDTDTSIYAANGNLTGARTVTMGAHNLTFASTTAGQEVKFEQNVEVAGQGYTDLYTGAAIDGIDWDNGNVQEVTLPNSATDFDPSNAEPGATYILILKQPASGAAGTINWAGGSGTVRWPDGTAPTLSTANNAVDIVTLVCVNTNSTYYATSVLNLS